MNELTYKQLTIRKKWALALAISILGAILAHVLFFSDFYGKKQLSGMTESQPLVINNVENNVNIEKQIVIKGEVPQQQVAEVGVLYDGYNTAKQALQKARDINTIAEYENYLNAFPNSPWKHTAEYYRDKLEAEALRDKNSISAYNQFLTQRPDSDWFNHVRHFRDRAEYKNAKKQDSSVIMQQFIDKYPQSDYRRKAEDVIRRLKSLDK